MFFRERIDTEHGAVAGLPAAVVAADAWRQDFANLFGNFGEDMAVKAASIECEKTRAIRCPLGDLCKIDYESHNLRGDGLGGRPLSEVYVFCPKQGPECEAMTVRTAGESDARLHDVRDAMLNAPALFFEPSGHQVPLQLVLF